MQIEETLILFLKQFQTPREVIAGQELSNLQGAAYLLYKELTSTAEQQVTQDNITIKFATDKEYNIMWECIVLLLIQDLLRNITPALSVVIPQIKLQEVKDKIISWSNKLSSKIEVINP